MSPQSVRGWAGAVVGVLGLLLWRAGPGFAEASAAAGCRDNASCRAVRSVEGVGTEFGLIESSNTASCQGDCNFSGTCAPITSDNGDGTETFQCSCDPNTSPAACSGFAKIKKATGECVEFTCMGSCDEFPPPQPPPPPKTCQREVYDTTASKDCPPIVTYKVRCVCLAP